MKKDLIKTAMNFFQDLKDNRGDHLLEADNTRPNQFRKQGTLWASPKIRVCRTPDVLLDFFTDVPRKQWPLWEEFLSNIVSAAPKHWKMESEPNSQKSKLIRINVASTETIEDLCKEFYNLFARFDQFLKTGKC